MKNQTAQKHTPAYPRTPELDKMKAVQGDSQVIGAFIDSLSEQGIHLAKYGDGDDMWPVSKSIEQILADYFEIDLVKVEKERRAILDHIRK